MVVDITADLVKKLRERTGAGVMECKKSLVETQGNIELAIDNMRKSGYAKAVKKACRIATEGIILVKISQNCKYGVIIELNCETDFVAKDNDFRNFGNEIVTVALNNRISNIEDLKAKFNEKRTVLITKIGENINIRRFSIIEGDTLSYYLHGTRIGVIISANSANNKLMKHIAMHIAASKPEYINANDIPANIIAREYQIQLDIAMQFGKPLEIAEKIAKGRMRKFTNEISLMNQYFVMEPNKTVGQLLNEYNTKINNFIRFELGEGIEKT